MTILCEHDSGSATDCRPLCDAPATRTVAYPLPCYGTVRVHVCARHELVTVARCYPFPATVSADTTRVERQTGRARTGAQRARDRRAIA